MRSLKRISAQLEERVLQELHERYSSSAEQIENHYHNDHITEFYRFLETFPERTLDPVRRQQLQESKVLTELASEPDQSQAGRVQKKAGIRSFLVGLGWTGLYYATVIDPVVSDANNFSLLPFAVGGGLLAGIGLYYVSSKHNMKKHGTLPDETEGLLEKRVRQFTQESKPLSFWKRLKGYCSDHKAKVSVGVGILASAPQLHDYALALSERSDISYVVQSTTALGLHVSLLSLLIYIESDLIHLVKDSKQRKALRHSLSANARGRKEKKRAKENQSSIQESSEIETELLQAYHLNPQDYRLLTDLTERSLQRGNYQETLSYIKDSLYAVSHHMKKESVYHAFRGIEIPMVQHRFVSTYLKPYRYENNGYMNRGVEESVLFDHYIPLLRSYIGSNHLDSAELVFRFLLEQVSDPSLQFGMHYTLTILSSEQSLSQSECDEFLERYDGPLNTAVENSGEGKGCTEVELHTFSQRHLLFKRYPTPEGASYEKDKIQFLSDYFEGERYHVADAVAQYNRDSFSALLLDRESGKTLFELNQEKHPHCDTFYNDATYVLAFIHSLFPVSQPLLDIPSRLKSKFTRNPLLPEKSVDRICQAFFELNPLRKCSKNVFDKDSHSENIIISFPDATDYGVTVIDFEDRGYSVKDHDDLANLISYGRDLTESNTWERSTALIRKYHQFSSFLKRCSGNPPLSEDSPEASLELFYTNTMLSVVYRALCLYDSLSSREERQEVRQSMIDNANVCLEKIPSFKSNVIHKYREQIGSIEKEIKKITF